MASKVVEKPVCLHVEKHGTNEARDIMEYTELEAMAAKYSKRLRTIGAQNKQIKWLNDITNNKRSNPNKVYIIEGIWAHKKALLCKVFINSTYICPELLATTEGKELAEKYIAMAENVFIMTKKVIGKICELENNSSGIVSACTIRQWQLSDVKLSDSNLLVVLDGLEIPGNTGTIMRSVDGAGADGVIFCNRKIRHNHPKLIRSSQCTCFSLTIIDAGYDELFSWLADNSFRILLLDTESQTEYHRTNYSGRIALVAGSERYGISQRWYDIPHESTFIPMQGVSDSLNVAVATTMVVYEAMYRR